MISFCLFLEGEEFGAEDLDERFGSLRAQCRFLIGLVGRRLGFDEFGVGEKMPGMNSVKSQGAPTWRLPIHVTPQSAR